MRNLSVLSLIVLFSCGTQDKPKSAPEEAAKKSTDDLVVAKPTPVVSPTPTIIVKEVIKEEKNTDAAKLAAPCTENEENLARIISSDNEQVAQFCVNRQWGNPTQLTSYLRCTGNNFFPVLTEEKTGVSCRNTQKVVSLKTKWYPSRDGEELCNQNEKGHWFQALDKEGRSIALRCSDDGSLKGLELRSRFACNDPDHAFQTTIDEDGKAVACRNGYGVISLMTIGGASYLTNSNCGIEGQWVKYKDVDGFIKASKCETYEWPAPGLFLNLTSPASKLSCAPGKEPIIAGDKLSASCPP